MAKFDIRNWKQLNEDAQAPRKRMTEREKRETLEAVSKFNEYNKSIYKTEEITEMVENLKTLSENASRMVTEETADWFDAVSVKRDTKAIGEAVKVFEGTAKEMGTLQQRLESVFEDIGGKLGKYYEIKELVEDEKLDAVGKEDDDVDNDGDSDEEDKYLKTKRAAVTKAIKNENKFKNQVNEAFEGLTNVISPSGYTINMKEAAPKMKKSKESQDIKKVVMITSGLKKGGSGNRYGKEFDKAKQKALKALQDMLTYSNIGV